MKSAPPPPKEKFLGTLLRCGKTLNGEDQRRPQQALGKLAWTFRLVCDTKTVLKELHELVRVDLCILLFRYEVIFGTKQNEAG